MKQIQKLKSLPWFGKALITVALAIASFYGMKQPILQSVCSDYNISE